MDQWKRSHAVGLIDICFPLFLAPFYVEISFLMWKVSPVTHKFLQLFSVHSSQCLFFFSLQAVQTSLRRFFHSMRNWKSHSESLDIFRTYTVRLYECTGDFSKPLHKTKFLASVPTNLWEKLQKHQSFIGPVWLSDEWNSEWTLNYSTLCYSLSFFSFYIFNSELVDAARKALISRVVELTDDRSALLLEVTSLQETVSRLEGRMKEKEEEAKKYAVIFCFNTWI